MNAPCKAKRAALIAAIAAITAFALLASTAWMRSALAFETPDAAALSISAAQTPADEQDASGSQPEQASVTVPAGLYELQAGTKAKLRLGVAGSSIKSGANAALRKRSSSNSQKFVIAPAKNGYYRIKMSMGRCVLSAARGSAKPGANARMEKWRNSASQLWKPIKAGKGIAFVNKRSGERLSFTSARSGANARLSSAKTPERLTTWTLKKTKLNGRDEKSFRTAIRAASGGGLKLGNASGYRVSKKLWKRLKSQVSACRSRGASVSFIMLDLCTGMTVSLHPDQVRFGASTVKGLYVTYLFQKRLEKGGLAWREIASLAHPAIVYSNNDAYAALRARYGSASGFNGWLKSAGVGPIGTYGNYSARTLAKAWTHMAGYAASKGRYVKTWKKLFRHSDHSFIHEALAGKSRSTYTKPGWMEPGTWSGTIMNDAGMVCDRKGNRYLLAFSTTVNPDAHRHQLRSIVKTLDSIHKQMTRKRGW